MKSNYILLDMFDSLGDLLWEGGRVVWMVTKIGLFMGMVPFILLWLWGNRGLSNSTYEDYVGGKVH